MKHTLLPLKDESIQEESESNILLMIGKELLQEVKKEDELHFALVGKTKVILTSTNLDDFPTEVRILLDEYADIIVDELPNTLPCVRSNSHHIDLILGASLPSMAAYKLTPQENEEIKQQVQEMLDKGLVKESLSLCAVPTVLSQRRTVDGECASTP